MPSHPCKGCLLYSESNRLGNAPLPEYRLQGTSFVKRRSAVDAQLKVANAKNTLATGCNLLTADVSAWLGLSALSASGSAAAVRNSIRMLRHVEALPAVRIVAAAAAAVVVVVLGVLPASPGCGFRAGGLEPGECLHPSCSTASSTTPHPIKLAHLTLYSRRTALPAMLHLMSPCQMLAPDACCPACS